MIDLQQFCAPASDNRPTLEQPWRDGDYVFASNGKILVRVSTEHYLTVEENAHTPKTSSWDFDGIRDWQDWIPIPAELPENEKEICKTCDGRGEHACGQCAANHACGKCKGSGHIPLINGVQFGAARLNPDLLRLLAKLPGVLIQKREDEPHAPRTFKFDQGEGFIAVLRTKGDEV